MYSPELLFDKLQSGTYQMLPNPSVQQAGGAIDAGWYEPPPMYGDVRIKQEFPCSDEEDTVPSLPPKLIHDLQTLVLEQTRKDMAQASRDHGIPANPLRWTPREVALWIEWTKSQLDQYTADVRSENFVMDGRTFCSLPESEFIRRCPNGGGDVLFARLEIWKSASIDWYRIEDSLPAQDPWIRASESPGQASLGSAGEELDDEVVEGRSKPSSHIHLWQFLKELLSKPMDYGNIIRWIDRQAYIFKIEDSTRVAQLWGMRKNRPAMNYDKLSRSIRQYYKKGIMKKTERSQRLVYQYCHPYGL